MRPLHILCLLALLAVVGELHAQPPRRPHEKHEGPPPERASFSTVVTEFGVTSEDAEQVAYRSARKQVEEFLQRQSPPITWRRAPEELDRFIDKDSVETEEITDQKLKDLGFRYRTLLSVNLKPRDFREILETEHQHELEERHWFFAKVLAGVIALLGTVAVYFRLEEWSKGYYTFLLRVVAATVLTAVLGGLLMLP